MRRRERPDGGRGLATHWQSGGVAELTGDFTTELGGTTLGLVYETLGG